MNGFFPALAGLHCADQTQKTASEPSCLRETLGLGWLPAACTASALFWVISSLLGPFSLPNLPQPDAELLPLLLPHFEEYIPPFIPSFQECGHRFKLGYEFLQYWNTALTFLSAPIFFLAIICTLLLSSPKASID